MLVNFKDIPFYYLNFNGYIERRAKMESLINNIGINAIRISNNAESELRQNRIALGVIKLLSIAKEIGIYPFISMDDDMELIKDIPSSIKVPKEADFILLGGSLYETGGHKPNMKLENFDNEYYRVYYMLSMHCMVIPNEKSANTLLGSIKESLENNQFLDIDLSMRCNDIVYLTPKDGPYFYQNNYNESVTRFLWEDVKDSYTGKYL